MRILTFSIQGYKRFSEKSVVRLDSRLIAVVGPNEAGKSTLLNAMEIMNDDDPIPKQHRSRTRSHDEPELCARFVLDPADTHALNEIAGGTEVKHCDFVKGADGKIAAKPHPRPPHDPSSRSSVVSELEWLKASSHYSSVIRSDKVKLTEEAVNAGLELLRASNELNADEVAKIRQLSKAINSATTVQTLSIPGNLATRWREVANAVAKQASLESATPGKQAEKILLARRPKFLFFDGDSRDLRRSYELDGVKPLPPALTNLARLASLDLERLRTAAKEGNVSEHTALIRNANSALRREFGKSWVDRDVVPELNLQSSTLYLMVQAAGGQELSYVDERSDGLRWFVSLLGFLAARDVPEQPILLVDEAESHLSYDAQANLIGVLNAQRLAQQVIYTTHSAGCLPSDLGTCIRTVVPEKNVEESTVNNSFWAKGKPGFTPILLAMGASALAFTPARYVVIGEGISECILLPTLLRQAIGQESLPFQVAPGISETPNNELHGLSLEGSKVVYAVDGDSGGKQHKRRLRRAGVPPERILSFGEVGGRGLTLEDFVELEVFVAAVNGELADWQGSSKTISADAFDRGTRCGRLNNWLQANGLNSVNKVTLCQRIVDMRYEVPTLLSQENQGLLVDLYQRLQRALGLDDKSS